MSAESFCRVSLENHHLVVSTADYATFAIRNLPLGLADFKLDFAAQVLQCAVGVRPEIKNIAVNYGERWAAVELAEALPTIELLYSEKVLKMPRLLTLGITRYAAVYSASRPDIDSVEKLAVQEVQRYEVARMREESNANREHVDSEGFARVIRKKGAPKKSFSAREKLAALHEKMLRPELYSFLSNKLSRIAELQEKFVKDKERIAKLRASRKFRPYG